MAPGPTTTEGTDTEMQPPADMNLPPVVSPQEWEAAREELLVKEKELTRREPRS